MYFEEAGIVFASPMVLFRRKCGGGSVLCDLVHTHRICRCAVRDFGNCGVHSELCNQLYFAEVLYVSEQGHQECLKTTHAVLWYGTGLTCDEYRIALRSCGVRASLVSCCSNDHNTHAYHSELRSHSEDFYKITRHMFTKTSVPSVRLY